MINQIYSELTTVTSLAVDFVTKSKKLKELLFENIKEVLQSSRTAIQLDIDQIFEREKIPSTLNHYFFEEIQKARSEDLIRQITELDTVQDAKKFPLSGGNNYFNKSTVLSVINNYFGVGTLPNEIFEAKEMAIYINAYLKVAKKRFIDSVCGAINVELKKLTRHITTNIQVTDTQLCALIGDDYATQRLREKYKKDIETCQKSLDEFKKYVIY